MINNVVNKPLVQAQTDIKPATNFNNKLLTPSQDKITFSATCSDNIVTKNDVDKRIKEFKKIMKGQPIPPEVMKVRGSGFQL